MRKDKTVCDLTLCLVSCVFRVFTVTRNGNARKIPKTQDGR